MTLPTSADSKPASQPPLRILLAEDHPVNQQVATAILKKHGHRVTIAQNGLEALEALSKATFDLVLMDIQMPLMDGLAAAAKIRQNERQTGAHLPIVALTADGEQGDQERFLNAGMDAYLVKPIKPAVLLSTLASLSGGEPAAQKAPEQRTAAAVNSIDWDTVLAYQDGDIGAVRYMITLFLQDYTELLDHIQQAIADRDQDLLERSTHTLKGEVALFDLRQAHGLALDLEAKGKAGNFAAAPPIYTALVDAIEAQRPALEAFSCGRQPGRDSERGISYG